jgi:hypothetical protein
MVESEHQGLMDMTSSVMAVNQACRCIVRYEPEGVCFAIDRVVRDPRRALSHMSMVVKIGPIVMMRSTR